MDTAALCSSVNSLKASLMDLKNTSFTASGISGIPGTLKKIQQDLQGIKASAPGAYTAEINALQLSLSGLSTSFNAAKANPNGGTLTALASAAGSVVTAGNNLVTAVSRKC